MRRIRIVVHIMRSVVLVAMVLSFIVTTGCGDGNDQQSGNAWAPTGNGSPLMVIETYYPDGALESRGTVNEGGQRQGAWQHWFSDGSVLFTGEFDGSVLVNPWIEYNANGSVRYSSADGPHPRGGTLPALP